MGWDSVREAWKADGGTPLHSDPDRQYGIKKISGLYQLWYWRLDILLYSTHVYSCLHCTQSIDFSMQRYRPQKMSTTTTASYSRCCLTLYETS
jgi:hypothetical protein